MGTNMIMIKRIGLIAAGGIVGGIMGYFLGGLIVDQLEKRREESEIGEWRYGEEEPYNPEAEKMDYTKFAKQELSELVKPYSSSIHERPEKSTTGTAAKSDNIRIISFDEFQSSRSANKEPIAYYEEDTTFANAQEEIVDDPNGLFGVNVHLHFGEESDDPDIVYVRNENNGVDYEITRVRNSYSVVVLGMPVEAPKETKAKQRRRSTKKVDTTHGDKDDEDEQED